MLTCRVGQQPSGNQRMHEAIRGRDPGDTRQVQHRIENPLAAADAEQFDFECLVESVFSRLAANIGISHQVGVGVGVTM